MSHSSFVALMILTLAIACKTENITEPSDISVWQHLYQCYQFGANPDIPGNKSRFDIDDLFRRNAAGDTFNPNKDINLFLYNQKFPNGHKLVLEDAHLLAEKPVKFLVHGFLSNSKADMVLFIKDAYLKHGSTDNIIAVDWSKGSGTMPYEYVSIAGNHVPMVAERLAKFIVFLNRSLRVQIEDVNLIGFSLGAHIVGLAGKNVQKTLNQTLPWIVGLDPASLMFKYSEPENRLNATDAEYVEVIHSATGCLGVDYPVGTVDYFPNYESSNRKMPGCGYDPAWDCSHGRAYEYFAETINTPTGFKAYKCPSFTHLRKNECDFAGEVHPVGGEPLMKKPSGIYWFKTGASVPFSKLK